jgi:hypothetical protein
MKRSLRSIFGMKPPKSDRERMLDEAWPERALSGDACRSSIMEHLDEEIACYEWLEAKQDEKTGKWLINRARLTKDHRDLDIRPLQKKPISFREMMTRMALFEQATELRQMRIADDDLSDSLKELLHHNNSPHFHSFGADEAIIFDTADGVPYPCLKDIFLATGKFDLTKLALTRTPEQTQTIASIWLPASNGELGINSLIESQKNTADIVELETSRTIIKAMPAIMNEALNDVYVTRKHVNSAFDKIGQFKKPNISYYENTNLYRLSIANKYQLLSQQVSTLADIGDMTTRMKFHGLQFQLFLELFMLGHALSITNPDEEVTYAISVIKNLNNKTKQKLEQAGKEPESITRLTNMLFSEDNPKVLKKQMETVITQIEREAELFSQLLGAPRDWQQSITSEAAPQLPAPNAARRIL